MASEIKFNPDEDTNVTYQFKSEQCIDLINTSMPNPQPPPTNNLMNPDVLKKKKFHMDLANALNIESSALPTNYSRQQRFNKFGGKYTVLKQKLIR